MSVDRPSVDDEPAVQPFEVGAVPPAKSIRRFTAQAANARGATPASARCWATSTTRSSASRSASASRSGSRRRCARRCRRRPRSEAPLTLSLATLVVVIIIGARGRAPVARGTARTRRCRGRGGGLVARAAGRPTRPAAPRGAPAAAARGLRRGDPRRAPGRRAARRPGPARRRGSASTAALVAAGIVLLAAVGQSASVSRRSIALAGDVLLFLAPVAAVVLARVGWSVDEVPGAPWWFVVGARPRDRRARGPRRPSARPDPVADAAGERLGGHAGRRRGGLDGLPRARPRADRRRRRAGAPVDLAAASRPADRCPR